MVRRVLIHRPGSLGDTVVALPCLHLIRRTFPDTELRVLTNAPVADSAPPLFSVLDGSGLIDGHLEYSISLRDGRRLWRLVRDIRRWQPDIVVHLCRRERMIQVLRDGAFYRACGVRNIVGLPVSRDLLLSRPLPGGLLEREAARLARNLAPLGAVDLDDPASWDLRLNDADCVLPRRLIADFGPGPFIVLAIGTKQPTNDWGVANWRTLAVRLCAIYPHRLVFIGAAGDRALSETIAAALADRSVNLCGMLKVRESAALIEQAALFVGHDSGPMHLAASVGTPLVAVFSRLNRPGIWFPGGKSTRVLYPYDPATSVLSITPEMVIAAVRTLLP